MKRKAVLLFIILGFKTVGYSQDFALKTNGLYWATTTLNMGVEKAISNQVTLEADVASAPGHSGKTRRCTFSWCSQK